MTTVSRRKAFQFFLENAGYVTPPGRAACALELARAEELLETAIDENVAEVVWEWDDTPYDPGDVCTLAEAREKFESNEWTGPFGCVLKIDGETVESLWGIVVGPNETNDPYCRVIAAELASQCEDMLRQALGDARDDHN